MSKAPTVFVPSAEMVSVFSLKSIGKKQQAAQLRYREELRHRVIENEPYTQEQFFGAWKGYLALLQQQSKSVLLSFLADKPSIENNTIYVKVTSESAKKEIQFDAENMLNFIRKQLRNSAIDIDFVFVAETEVKRQYIFSSHDKYTKLLEENPYLEEFRKSLQLNF